MEMNPHATLLTVCNNSVYYTGGFGAWSADDCREVATGSGNEKVCECTQLAHFGILFVSIHSYLLCPLIATFSLHRI